MKKICLLLLLTAFLLPLPAITLKFASPLPEGTEWDLALRQMADEWAEITGGAVRLRIYAGGIAGEQSDVIRKMRIGQLDMAVLTSLGLANIVPDSFVMTMPLYLRSEEELDFVIREIAPGFDEAFLAKGYTMLGWSKSGWVNFFSKEKLVYPEDLRTMKFSASTEEPEMISAFKEMGFNVIPLNMNSLLMGLQSGMVEAFYASPMASASYQWFGIADRMLDLNIAPILGGVIISSRSWERIPERYRGALKESLARMTRDFYRKTQTLETRAMTVMKANGLVVQEAPADAAERWRQVLGEDYGNLVGDGRLIPREVFQSFDARIREFRSR